MRFRYIMLFSLFLFCFGNRLFGQTVNARQLDDAISSGNVTIVSANGTGYITTVSGRLRNNTANEIQINVIINNGVYFSNSGSGQNMLALAILMANNEYYSSGTTKYIILPANATENITFKAYCTDRAKDAPKQNETLTRNNMPAGLRSIAAKLSNYHAENFDKDTGRIIQLALWREQRESIADIASIFDFSEKEWSDSSYILGVSDVHARVVPGTYSYNSSYTVGITGDGFAMSWEGNTYRGTYMVIGNTLILKSTEGKKFIFTIVNNAIQDREGDNWPRR